MANPYPLSKVMSRKDDDPHLVDQLALVEAIGIGAQASEHRAWEYAVALAAIDRWTQTIWQPRVRRLVDVGGAGSSFTDMVRHQYPGVEDHIVDPTINQTLQAYVASLPRLADIVTCLSVLEHLPPAQTEQFCYHLAALVAPGGLLVLTVDYAETATDPTAHHFYWMRERIFDFWSLNALRIGLFHELGFTVLGGADYAWPGTACCVYPSYTFASLVLQRRP
jgi:hypothetical protein